MRGRAGTASRYLIVKLGALGDVVMASTLVGAIRSRDASAHITWLCGAGVADLVRLFEGVDEVVVADDVALLQGGLKARAGALASLWRRLAGRRFDETLLAHADPRYRAMLVPARLGWLRTLAPHGRNRSMLPVPGRWFGDEYARMLDDGDVGGPVVGHAALARLVPRGVSWHAARGVTLVPGGARNLLRESALRRWPVERYRQLAERLASLGHGVTLVGNGGDAWVRPFFAGLDVRDEIGAHDIPGTLRVLAESQLVISHDTGPLHLAGLLRVPVLGLFGPTVPTQFMPPQDAAGALWGGAGLACRPCYDGREFAVCGKNLCMQDISVDQVVRRAADMLAAGEIRERPPTMFPT